MSEERILELFEKASTVITGSHFVYASDMHGSGYVNKNALYLHPLITYELCQETASRFLQTNHLPDIVIGPATGGIILSQVTAYHFSAEQHVEVLSGFVEKERVAIPDDIDPQQPRQQAFRETGRFVLQRGYDAFVKGKNVLVVEDVLTTGKSAKEVIKAVRRSGGNVVGLCALCNRGGVTRASLELDESHTFFSLTNVNFRSYNEADCPLCQQNIPIDTRLGKGKEFLARRQKS